MPYHQSTYLKASLGTQEDRKLWHFEQEHSSSLALNQWSWFSGWEFVTHKIELHFDIHFKACTEIQKYFRFGEGTGNERDAFGNIFQNE